VRIHLIVYLALTILLYRRYRRYLLQNFASEDRYAFRWVRSLLIVFLAGISFALVTNILEQVFAFSYVGSWYSYFVLAATIYIISIQFFLADPERLRSLRFDPEVTLPELAAAAPVTAAAADPELEHWGQRLDAHMAAARPYLNPDLNLGTLAEQIGTNSSVLSRVVNTREGLNFNDYINGFRCREVMRRFAAGDHENLTFLAMALDAGFNSKATFNRAFKKYTGKSPRAFVAALPGRSEEAPG
jgi:AraC-like DNA-binding protein